MYQIPDQSSRRVVITGANSGLGKQGARRLAAAGAEIIIGTRSIDKGLQAKAELLRTLPHALIEVRQLDLASMESVKAFTGDLLSEGKTLDTLINNAGVMTPPKREMTADGHELQFGTNFLGPFVLTNRLLPLLLRSSTPRVATMASGAAHNATINWNDVDFTQSYTPFKAYGQSKLADMLMGLELGRIAIERGWRLVSTLAHPGYTSTNLQTSGPNLGTAKTTVPLWMRLFPVMHVSKGVESMLMAATDPSAEQGDYYGPRWLIAGQAKKVGLPKSVREGEATRLWQMAEQLTDTRLLKEP